MTTVNPVQAKGTTRMGFRLTPEARALLTALAHYQGLTRTGALEQLIRVGARADLPAGTYARAVASAQREE